MRTTVILGVLLAVWTAEAIAPPVQAPQGLHAVPVPTEDQTRRVLGHPRKVQAIPGIWIDSETLWLARMMYSESNRLEEQELVGWVLRNRVESGYRGWTTYRGSVLAPRQYSAFTAGSATRKKYLSLWPDSVAPGWAETLALAFYVRHAPDSLRPFGPHVRHFYSAIAMKIPGAAPDWVAGHDPVEPARPLALDPERFRFYAGID